LPETQAKSSDAFKGQPRQPHSPETRRKISAAKKGQPHPPHSRATRARIRAAQKRIWAARRKQQPEQLVRGRKTALTIRLTPADRQTLRTWQGGRPIPARLARRGQVILLLADGMTITGITKTVGVGRNSVYRWVQRFLVQGVEGLANKPGQGRRRPGPPAGSAPSHHWQVS
jgi:Homeodomain-like domain-containing protein/NUMOD3 motif-containing protein